MRSAAKRLCSIILLLALTVSLFAVLAPAASAAELKTAIGTVNAGSLRLRETPSTTSRILATARRNDKVIVISREGDWYKVVYNLQTGYMHKDYLLLDEVKNIKIGYARFDYTTNVRRKPGTDSSIAAKAPRGDTCFIIGFNKGWYKVSYNGTPGYVRSDLVTMLEIPYENAGSPGNTYREGAPATPGEGYGSAGMTRNQKLKMIYGTTNISDYRRVYASSSEARSHMTSILIKTWDINDAGAKYTRTWKLEVHEKIAPTVAAIFAEIYALPEKPPIHSIGGYRWDGASEHSVGLAIDINPRENYYCNSSGKAITGSYFHPDSDPYSIPVGGSVDQIFAKYGFTRGIYWRNGYKDYMHYSFFGT
jgi:uncharacterized protein YgiM (DUF1202 family)